MIRIAICDDEINILQYISDKINNAILKLNYSAAIKSFSNSKELLEENSKECFDIIFLDLEMPEPDGLQTAELIRNEHVSTIIVIITNRDDLVFNTFQYDVSAFIRKKYFDDEIDDVIKRVYHKAQSRYSKYILKTENNETIFYPNDIMYIESENHNIYLHDCNGSKIKIFHTLEKLMDIISNKYFIRCHSGFIVNYNYVFSINKDNILLTNETSLPLSRGRKKEVKQGFQRFMRELQ